ncbi:type I 3-dehydroquinate dehydratase [Patescibacteria group bacterium]|nr:type I 3-dehydroquinate dehydratase [Patescibacteria group bacterium]
MNSLHVLPLQPESFVMLVNQLKNHKDQADIFEIWLDTMRVKGDLAVIQKHFKKPMIAKSNSLDLLKRGAKAGFTYVDVPHNLEVDVEFQTLVKNKGTKIIRSYHNFDITPAHSELQEILIEMKGKGADFLKISTMVHSDDDSQTLLSLLHLPHYKDKLIITGLGELSREVRIKAPVYGSVFYYAPLSIEFASAPGQITKDELENEWDLI